MRRIPFTTWVTLAVVGFSTLFVLWVVNPDGVLFSRSTPTGGDLGAHVWGPAFIRDELLPRFRLTGWTPDWYAGFPAFHFYMVVPMLMVVAVNVGLVAPLAVLLCTDLVPNINGYVFGVRGGSIYLYSNPQIERSIHRMGNYTMDEMDVLVPKMLGTGF